MTAVAESPFAKESPAGLAPAQGWWARLEPWLERGGDLLNPILVKEARQAMKSRQFSITYTLLLVLGWIWTALFCIAMAPRIYYVPHGVTVLAGYYIVLNIPLLIVVPFAAFRSLAAEREDGTYEMLSITTLGARQIVVGKLSSAILQMLLYYSALAPCIAFTYLLRGIDIVTIAMFLAYTFLASLMLSMIGLMLATVTQARHWQLLLSVLFVMGLLAFTVMWVSATTSALAEISNMPYDDPDFWIGHLGMLSVYATFFALFLFLASGQVSFASDNRSTPVRIVLFIQLCLACGWLAYLVARQAPDDAVLVLYGFASGWLWFVGAFLSCELAELSPRARRQLPQSLLGRMAFTWFNPGSGTGYVFACLNIVWLAVMLVVLVAVAELTGQGGFRLSGEVWELALGVVAYSAAYLGLGRLFMLLVRRFQRAEVVMGVLFQVIIPLLGIAFPLLLMQLMVTMEMADYGYTPLQITNWAWTLMQIGENRGASTPFFLGGGLRLTDAEVSLMIVTLAAAAIFLLNLFFTTEEVDQTHQAAPQRVREEELALHPELVPAPPKNPWST
jgi:hypothetical protein